jgi:hypothetical protein
MKHKHNQESGFTIVEFLIGIVIMGLFLFGVYLVFIRHSKANNSTRNSTATKTFPDKDVTVPAGAAFAVLSPATVASKVAECQQAITYASSGSPSPLQCSNGYINVTAWQALSALEPTVMSLGYGASESQVQTAICADANAADEDSSASTSNAIEGSVYQISKLYYGWNFGSDPSAVLTNGTC